MVGLGGLERPTSPLSVLRSLSQSIILPDIGCGPAPQSKADALARIAAMWGPGASKEQQALACLGLRTKYPDLRMGFWKVCLDIREVQVQRHQHTIFREATLGEHSNRQHQKFSRRRPYLFEACLAKDRRVFCWKVSSILNFIVLISSGKSIVPSRVNSAAYANAASTSGTVSAGQLPQYHFAWYTCRNVIHYDGHSRHVFRGCMLGRGRRPRLR